MCAARGKGSSRVRQQSLNLPYQSSKENVMMPLASSAKR